MPIDTIIFCLTTDMILISILDPFSQTPLDRTTDPTAAFADFPHLYDPKY